MYDIMLETVSALQKPVTAHDSATSVTWLSQDAFDDTIPPFLLPYMAKL